MTCAACSTAEFLAERADAFKTANALLQGADIPGDTPYTVSDVMELTCLLLDLRANN